MASDPSDHIEAIVSNKSTGCLVDRYFNGAGPFAGLLFDSIEPNPPIAFDHADLLAVTLLDIRFTPPAVRALTEEPTVNWGDLLSPVPTDVDLWDATDEHLDAAEVVWNRLRELDHVDWVIAGKLLARKRPRLVPIVDSVVVRAAPSPHGQYWRAFREYLRDDKTRSRVEALRPAGAPAGVVSTLRLLDTALWMSSSMGEKARAARTDCGYGEL